MKVPRANALGTSPNLLGFRGHLITNFPHVMVLLIINFICTVRAITIKTINTEINWETNARVCTTETLTVLSNLFTQFSCLFLLQVVCYPYKLYNVSSFLRLISAEPLILKDCIQIIRMELVSRRID